MLVLERKISMRKPREELVKRGVLLEDSEQGEFANQWHMPVSVYLVFGYDKVFKFSLFIIAVVERVGGFKNSCSCI